MLIQKKQITPKKIKQILKVLSFATISICSVLLSAPSIKHLNALPQKQPTPAKVLAVIDGDTLVVEINKTMQRLRLIGIDTPETKPNRRATIQAQQQNLDRTEIYKLGERAASFTRQLLPRNTDVVVERDVTKRDRYGRLLGYVWRREFKSAGQSIMINEEIVRAGYANVLTIPPNIKYQERFLKAFKDARLHRRGLWSQD